MSSMRRSEQFEHRRHHRIRPVDVHATIVGENVIAASGRVHDLSLGGMLIEHADAVRLGERIWLRLLSGGRPWFGIAGVVVRREARGIAVQFASLTQAALDRFERVILREHVRATRSLTMVAHRSREEGKIIVAMLARVGLPAVYVRTPLELVVAMEDHREVASALLVDEFFWGRDLEPHSRFLAELYPSLNMSLLVRSCSQTQLSENVFRHVARKPWHVEQLRHLARPSA